MNSRGSISAYTPSNTDPAVLKRIFVQREKLLDRIVDRLSRSMTTGDKHHLLLVGPRGSGKTHLVSLATWELQQRENLRDVMRIAWLGEDDSFTGLIHFAFGIAKQLAQEYPEEFPSDFKTAVRGLPPDDAALTVLRSVVEQLKDRNLILVTENLDQTFRGLGDTGRKQWRAFLQETRKIATLATSQQLFAGVSDRKEAFFGFFDIQHLEPLSVDEARELIRRISVEQNKPQLGDYLNSAEGRYRIRALHYLAGGNHRMYVLLAEFLTKDSLDDLVTAFEGLAHDMTPYFQERVRSLPDQQRQLVQCLCDAEGALTVKRIAEETFIDERSCSKQLGNLKAKGYVRSEKRGKESYYDMAEPLMRLCLEVKNQRGKPLKLVVRFLKAWFPAATLQGLKAKNSIASRADAYRLEAANCRDHFQIEIAKQLDESIRRNIEAGKLEAAKHLVDELQFADSAAAVRREAQLATLQGNLELVASKITQLIEMSDGKPYQKAMALVARGLAYGEQGDVERALADYSAVIEMPDAPPYAKANALVIRGFTYKRRSDEERALSDYSAVIEMPDAPSHLKVKTLGNRGVAYSQQGDLARALSDFSALIDMIDASSDLKAPALLCRGAIYGQLSSWARALSDYSAVIEMSNVPSGVKAQALVNRGVTYRQQGDVASALADYSAVIKMPNAPPGQKADALDNRGVTRFQDEEFEASTSDFEAILSIAGASNDQRTLALFFVPNPMVAHCNRTEVIEALARAFTQGDRQSREYGGMPDDLLRMVLRHSSVEWPFYVAEVAALFIEHDAAEKLGQGITQSIRYLDEGGFSSSQIDEWNSVWQKAGKDCEDLQIPLRCLDAAVEVIQSDPKTDRPLFRLPLEIRRLVRPLLNKSLGETNNIE